MASPIRIAILADGVNKARKGFDSVAEGAKTSFGKLGALGAKAGPPLAVAGAAVGAIFINEFGKALDVQEAQQNLKAQLGFGDADSEKAGKVAGDLWKNAYGESLGEVNDVLKTVFQSGIVTAKSSESAIKGVTEQVLNYSKLTGEDALASTRAVSQMLKTGLAKNATQAFDLLTRGQQLGINKSEDLLDTFNEYGTQFRKIGLDGPQALGLLQQGLQGGARDADLVADALKEFSIRAVDGSATSAAAFKALGLDAEKMTATFAKGGPNAAAGLQLVFTKLKAIKDPAARSAAAVGLFGTQAEDMGDALFKLDLSTAVKGLGQVDGAAKKAGDTLNNTAKSKLETFKRSLQANLTDALVKALPTLEQFATWVTTKAVPALVTFFGKLKDPDVQAFLADLKELGKFLLETLGPVVKKLAETELNKFITVIRTTKAVLDDLVKLKKDVEGFFNGIKAKIDGAGKSAEGAGGSLKKTGGKLVDGLKEGWNKQLPTARTLFGKTKTNVFNWVGGTAGTLRSKGQNFIYGLANGASSVIGTVSGLFGGLPGRVFAWMGNTANTLGAKGKNFIYGLMNGVSSVIGEVSGFFSGLGGKIVGWVGGLDGVLYGAGQAVIRGLINGLGSMFGALGSKLGEFTSFIKNNKGPIEKDRRLLEPAGRAIIDGLIKGMSRRLPKLKKELGTFSRVIQTGVKPDVQVGFEHAKNAALNMLRGDLSPRRDLGDAGGLRPINLNVYALAGGPEVGRQVIEAIQMYEASNGARWRRA